MKKEEHVVFDSDKQQWLSGNEAIAQGAWEAGITVASGYPGTPSTEIMGNFARYEGVYAEWAPNEKVGLEVAIGASFAGSRALATMKHVGLNVAADPLFTAAYTGVRGGLVIVNADDPQMHSSQNEQDNRNYAFAAKVPMLEPSDPAEAKAMVGRAVELSEQLDTPVMMRITTRIAHVKGVVEKGERVAIPESSIEKMPAKMVMLPGNARVRRVAVEKRMAAAREVAETLPENRIEEGEGRRGFICAGTSYNCVKEAFPDVPVLKLGMVWPLPEKMIRTFAESVDELIIVEELDPFLETHIKAMGIECHGEDIIPNQGELNSFIVQTAVDPESRPELFEPQELPMRPPNMCAGCPHRGLFYSLSKMKNVFVSGDIGCYTLGFLPPLSAMDACVCMGASVSMAHGMSKALGEKGQGKVVSVIGDSTFMHSGITGLLNTVYNDSYASVIILDNRITAMTGHQNNPASGRGITGEPANTIDFEQLCTALGVKRVVTINPNDVNETRRVLKEEIASPDASVIISRAPCILLPEEVKRKKPAFYTRLENCVGCTACVQMGCPAISWHPITPEQAVEMGYREKQRGYAEIAEVQCNGCGQCAAVCTFDAITGREVA
ncbi:MAG: indolepyruvate ferredoxin oxidoreductase subunit alpha [Desulfobulbus propionicus]|nr:MAG: indolepyruvate ferredoxin oxidoreductase subunit alpha [Desulfobulbus propionicus]